MHRAFARKRVLHVVARGLPKALLDTDMFSLQCVTFPLWIVAQELSIAPQPLHTYGGASTHSTAVRELMCEPQIEVQHDECVLAKIPHRPSPPEWCVVSGFGWVLCVRDNVQSTHGVRGRCSLSGVMFVSQTPVQM